MHETRNNNNNSNYNYNNYKNNKKYSNNTDNNINNNLTKSTPKSSTIMNSLYHAKIALRFLGPWRVLELQGSKTIGPKNLVDTKIRRITNIK